MNNELENRCEDAKREMSAEPERNRNMKESVKLIFFNPVAFLVYAIAALYATFTFFGL